MPFRICCMAVVFVASTWVVHSLVAQETEEIETEVIDDLNPMGDLSTLHLGVPALYEPSELRFGCVVWYDPAEAKFADMLNKGTPHEKLKAARILWEARDRREATNVLQYLAGSPPGGEEFRKFQRQVEAELQPQAILRELNQGDYLWGAWLAFLRPHKEFVPVLLARLRAEKEALLLDESKQYGQELPATMLALGNSGDPRALAPLLELLQINEYITAGDAAEALGYLGDAAAEKPLVDALGQDNNWLRVNGCVALGQIGSRQALPALEKLAQDDRYTGALGVKSSAQRAMERIKERAGR